MFTSCYSGNSKAISRFPRLVTYHEFSQMSCINWQAICETVEEMKARGRCLTGGWDPHGLMLSR